MTTHELKCLSPYFEDVRHHGKNFEVRLNDRNYQVGDILVLKEYTAWLKFTGEEEVRRVTYILSDFVGLKPDYVVLGMTKELYGT